MDSKNEIISIDDFFELEDILLSLQTTLGETTNYSTVALEKHDLFNKILESAEFFYKEVTPFITDLLLEAATAIYLENLPGYAFFITAEMMLQKVLDILAHSSQLAEQIQTKIKDNISLFAAYDNQLGELTSIYKLISTYDYFFDFLLQQIRAFETIRSEGGHENSQDYQEKNRRIAALFSMAYHGYIEQEQNIHERHIKILKDIASELEKMDMDGIKESIKSAPADKLQVFLETAISACHSYNKTCEALILELREIYTHYDDVVLLFEKASNAIKNTAEIPKKTEAPADNKNSLPMGNSSGLCTSTTEERFTDNQTPIKNPEKSSSEKLNSEAREDSRIEPFDTGPVYATTHPTKTDEENTDSIVLKESLVNMLESENSDLQPRGNEDNCYSFFSAALNHLLRTYYSNLNMTEKQLANLTNRIEEHHKVIQHCNQLLKTISSDSIALADCPKDPPSQLSPSKAMLFHTVEDSTQIIQRSLMTPATKSEKGVKRKYSTSKEELSSLADFNKNPGNDSDQNATLSDFGPFFSPQKSPESPSKKARKEEATSQFTEHKEHGFNSKIVKKLVM